MAILGVSQLGNKLSHGQIQFGSGSDCDKVGETLLPLISCDMGNVVLSEAMSMRQLLRLILISFSCTSAITACLDYSMVSSYLEASGVEFATIIANAPGKKRKRQCESIVSRYSFGVLPAVDRRLSELFSLGESSCLLILSQATANGLWSRQVISPEEDSFPEPAVNCGQGSMPDECLLYFAMASSSTNTFAIR